MIEIFLDGSEQVISSAFLKLDLKTLSVLMRELHGEDFVFQENVIHFADTCIWKEKLYLSFVDDMDCLVKNGTSENLVDACLNNKPISSETMADERKSSMTFPKYRYNRV